jgi:Ca2+-binding RTX toxin-like protein
MNTSNARRLGMESLESRQLMAAVVSGNLDIVGSNSADNVKVEDVVISGISRIRVTQNGNVQTFNASSVTGRVRFWGYGGNDRFDYYGGKNCYVDGGAGNDFISADRGNDLLVGGDGNDTIEGWGGNDELQGGYGDDVLDGGAGHDRLFGQAGADILGGGSGDDQIIGGTGIDIAFGGSGNDQFWECRDIALFFTPLNTRFGWASSAGVQDAIYGDRIWS